MIGQHKRHLAMRQNRGLGPPRCTGCKKEPAGIIVINGCIDKILAQMAGDDVPDAVAAERPVTKAPNDVKALHMVGNLFGMIGEIAMA